jgi:hypothetical protein
MADFGNHAGITLLLSRSFSWSTPAKMRGLAIKAKGFDAARQRVVTPWRSPL